VIRFLVNPAGGRGRAAARLAELRALAAARGAELVVSRDAADLTAQARRAAAEGVERLLVAGGDGSVHLAIQGLAGSACALAVLPLGSGNDVAAILGVPPELAAAVEQGVAGPVRRVDLGRAGDRPYAGVAGVGFDSAANETANRVRRLSGSLIYLYAVLHTLVTFRPPRFEIDYQGGRFAGPAMMVVLANGGRFGGGMRIAPAARIDDGLLDLVVVRALPRRTFLAVFPRVYRGRHLGHPAVFTARTPWARVRLDRRMQVYGDGERLLPVPAEGVRFEVAPAGLLAVVGEGVAEPPGTAL
jgi:diacylglycerol kinase (ATP)